MELGYVKSGDYYIPELALPVDDFAIGKYGRLHRQYLKEHRPTLFANLLLSGELLQCSAEIKQSCTERMELLTRQIVEREGVTEALKATDQMEWVRRMNSIQNRAEDIVLYELVYC